jgi:DNA-binding GntR family transcriptional regulator|tara:strand:+ start:78 stop:752 length:675 start_codon:yes stop_codon:yes gene_type:complete
VNDKTMFKESPLIKRRTITEEVVDIIRKAIMEGHYANNQQITESRISEEFNISRAPVREALRELTNKGLVTHHPNRGYFLREFSIDDIEEICSLRSALEKLAVKLVIERASDEEINELGDIVDTMKNELPNMQHASIDDYQFHQKLGALSKHKHLQEYWSLMADQTSLAISNINRSFESASTGFVGGHKEILDAIRSRDTVKAEKLIEEHILVGVKNLKKSLRE